MHVLTICAHPNPQSFCHAVLDQFTAGLREAGHSSEVIDLYAIGLTRCSDRATRRAGSQRAFQTTSSTKPKACGRTPTSGQIFSPTVAQHLSGSKRGVSLDG